LAFIQVCNLPDHPIHAGCTAVCAVIVGGTLTVANAGDSRVVLCRQHGVTEAMSFDHKPMSEIEMKRITEAGGFVNQFGRVNGNLNLSRSIGDLKYKKVPNIAPADQMITAQPDIKSVTLNEKDEFIILACDVSVCLSFLLHRTHGNLECLSSFLMPCPS
jgi:serine/threonine protein phosphatase PrpC